MVWLNNDRDCEMKCRRERVYVRRSQFLNAQLGQPLALVNALVKRHASDEASGEARSEGVTSTGGIID